MIAFVDQQGSGGAIVRRSADVGALREFIKHNKRPLMPLAAADVSIHGKQVLRDLPS
jgi:hypothetical protein